METFSITFGDQAENNIGMQKLGNLADEGFNIKDLTNCIKAIKEKSGKYQLYCLDNNLPQNLQKEYDAYLLVIKNGVNLFLDDKNGADKMFEEQKNLPFDKKALMRGKVKNKRARWNSCFAEEGQEPDIENGKGTVIAFNSAPILNKLRKTLSKYLGKKADNLYAEMNYYYDIKKCGIGFHGDAERKKVVCARLGASIPMHFQWFHKFKPVGTRFAETLDHGDIYIMSEKAVGTDWKKSSLYTLRHAAGCKKYLTIKSK